MNIQTKLNLHMESEGLHQEKLTVFGKKLLPMFMQNLLLFIVKVTNPLRVSLLLSLQLFEKILAV